MNRTETILVVDYQNDRGPERTIRFPGDEQTRERLFRMWIRGTNPTIIGMNEETETF